MRPKKQRPPGGGRCELLEDESGYALLFFAAGFFAFVAVFFAAGFVVFFATFFFAAGIVFPPFGE